MKIAFDVQLLTKGNKTGIACCAYNILNDLPNKENNQCYLNYFTSGYGNKRSNEIEKLVHKGYIIQECRWFRNIFYRILMNYIQLPYGLFFHKKVDATIFFNYIIPPRVKGKKIVFVHDMVYKACPETVRYKTKKMLELSCEKSCKRADMIVTDSEFSKSEIIKYLNIDSSKIKVLYCGVDLNTYHTDYKVEDITNVKTKYKIDGEYILYLGTIEPRKNIERIIEAYNVLYLKDKNCPKLVLAGGNGWLYDEIFAKAEELKNKGKIIFTGYVDEIDVPLLYCGASIFVFPSLYEGFGLPPLEAMACGTPVITSDAASLPEVVGNAAIKVNPLSSEAISDAMYLLCSNQALHDEYREKGLSQAKRYSWKRTAKKFSEIVQAIID